jgi:hypothetical protein
MSCEACDREDPRINRRISKARADELAWELIAIRGKQCQLRS